MTSTPLSRQLADGTPARPVALDAFKLARRKFMAGERIEMTRLAQELGVSRVTLNRWVGSRDLLVGEVNWSLAHPTLEGARRRVTSTGADAVAETLEGFMADVLATSYMRAFLAREPEIALRILTTAGSGFQARLVAYVAMLIEQELPRKELPLELDDLAYLIVRIAESFFYVDIIAGGTPDPGKAAVAVRALLR
ncbi:MAG TPA: QsdR family transcriptional regulator [Solirubrobacteraceae bacterium]